MSDCEDQMSAGLVKNRFVRFLIAGGINTIFGYCVFAALIFLRFHYAVAVLLSTVMGVLFNFKTTGKLVFGNSDNRLIFKFVSVYAVLYLINTGFLKVFNFYRVNMYLSGAVLLLPMALLSFFMLRSFVFEG